ncbi:hypothetical protein SNE40_010525 [Patella caerulea]|uniref:CMP/dCMP-type deaminase domain-containing protein n=1 Tax=Patella caerulea TaxID=87958 RepID=A0AAN8JW64_PATCE
MDQPEPILDDRYYQIIQLGDFYVSVIKDKKNTTKVIRELTERMPNKEFNYLKRVKSTNNKGDSLQVLLCPKDDVASINEVTLEAIIGEDSSILQYLGKPFLVKVPVTQPLTKKQHQEASLNWPCTFHEDKQITNLLSGKYFNDIEIEKIKKHMLKAVELAQISQRKQQEPIGAVIVDPTNDIIISASHDLRRGDHPLQHAVMICIDLVARSQGGGMWKLSDNDLVYNQDINTAISTENKTGPYLCTGYDLYVTQEPCSMCAMALVHSRINRVFYGSSHKEGALGSFYKIHTQKGLNHHYEVYKNTLSIECNKLYDQT